MPKALEHGTLRRLLISKELLASTIGQLRPDSDALAVARAILTSHDAAEIAAAAIADHVGVKIKAREKIYLLDYPSRIEEVCKDKGAFPGTTFVKDLNDARISFKHHGTTPDPRQWYPVVHRTWDLIDSWCSTYLGASLNEIDLQELLVDGEVKRLYQVAKAQFGRRKFKEALEWLGQALYLCLERFPGIRFPLLGPQSTDHALKVAAFGVRPSDFLNLQGFVPSVSKESNTGKLSIEWDLRETGNPANWTEQNVRFCLDTFLDLALKIQHAPWSPSPIHFRFVFDDVIPAKGDSVELWVYEFGPYSSLLAPLGLGRPTGKRVVRTLRKGDMLRCVLSPAKDLEKTEMRGIADLAPQTIETATVLNVLSDDIPERWAQVRREEIDITFAPKENDTMRKYFPHLFEKGGAGAS